MIFEQLGDLILIIQKIDVVDSVESELKIHGIIFKDGTSKSISSNELCLEFAVEHQHLIDYLLNNLKSLNIDEKIINKYLDKILSDTESSSIVQKYINENNISGLDCLLHDKPVKHNKILYYDVLYRAVNKTREGESKLPIIKYLLEKDDINEILLLNDGLLIDKLFTV